MTASDPMKNPGGHRERAILRRIEERIRKQCVAVVAKFVTKSPAEGRRSQAAGVFQRVANDPSSGSAVAGGALRMKFWAWLSLGLAVAMLVRIRWGVLLEIAGAETRTDSSVVWVALLYALVSAAHAGVLAALNRLLVRAWGYRGSDRATLVLVGLLCFDVIAHLDLARSGLSGFAVYRIPFGLYRMVFSYPQFAFFVMGVGFIAYGYSLLRFSQNLQGLLRPYARVQIVAGMTLAAPAAAWVAPWAASFGLLLLGRMFHRLSKHPGSA